jgi:hypothetical protein
MSLRVAVIASLAALSLQPVSAAEVTLSASSGFDLDTGYSEALGYWHGVAYDLVFSCGPQGHEYLRALGNASWAASPNNDFSAGPEVLRAATYAAPRNTSSGYPDLFHTRRDFVPTVGTVYFVRTTEGNLAKMRIAGYQAVDSNPYVCRHLRIEYVLYPPMSGLVGDEGHQPRRAGILR